MNTILWVWNGCLPDFPWWCDGFLWMAPFALILGGLIFSVGRRR
jgi:hypothetical protein